MTLQDLRDLLSLLPYSDHPPACRSWTISSAFQSLIDIRHWVEEEYSRQTQAKNDLAELRSRLHEAGGESAGVAAKVEEMLQSLDAAPPFEGGAVQAILTDARQVDEIQDCLDRLEARIGWLRSVQALLSSTSLDTTDRGDASAHTSLLRHAPTQSSGRGDEMAAGEPQLMLSAEDWRPLVRSAATKLRARLEAAAQSDERWGLDFGTAQSKLVFRHDGQPADEDGPNNILAPSVVALRGSKSILFGEDAAAVTGEEWSKTTSFKRLLIGKRMNQPKANRRLTTEGLTILYLAWMLHRAYKSKRRPESISAPCGLSYPIVPAAMQPKLRPPFTEQLTATHVCYRDWLPYAVRSAQLIATTLEDREWPRDQLTLANLLAVADHDHDFLSLRGSVRPETMSEPVAAMSSYPPPYLQPGFTLIVDAGAGTTDVSVFHSDGVTCRLLSESSVIAGGDTLDLALAAIIAERMKASADLIEREYGLQLREWKTRLVDQKKVDIDPEEVGLSGLAFTVRDDDPIMSQGFENLTSAIRDAVSTVLRKADRLSHQPSSSTSKPIISNVWLLGGSAVVSAVGRGVAMGIELAGYEGAATPIPLPSEYATWNPRQYAVRAVAIGASASSVARPTPARTHVPFESALGVTDKEIQ